MQKIEGREFGTYVVTAIQLGKSKSAGINANGKQSHYIDLFVKNAKIRLGRPRHIFMFEEEVPGLYEILYNYKTSETADENGRYTVDLLAFKNSADAAAMDGLLEFPGMTTELYKLRKGLCYQNDVDGKRVYFGKPGDPNREPVERDTISVLVQVDYAIDDGKFQKYYFDMMSPAERGAQMESTFYRVPVNATQ